MLYVESNKLNTKQLLLACSISIILSLFLGYIYSTLIYFIPLVYFNFIITLTTGFAISIIARIMNRISHNRSKTKRLIFALSIGIIFTIFQWLAYISIVSQGQLVGFSQYVSDLVWTTNPVNFFSIIHEINGIGLWTIFGATPTGIELFLIWLVEFLLVITPSFIYIFKSTPFPYSENKLKWYPKYVLEHNFESISTIKAFTKELNTNAISAIDNLGLGTAQKFTKIYVYYIEDELDQYISFERVFIGQSKTISSLFICNYKVDKFTADELLKKYRNTKERFEIV